MRTPGALRAPACAKRASPGYGPDAGSRARGEAVCAAFDFADPIAFADCVLDVGLTGQPAFAVAAAVTSAHIGPSTGAATPGATVVAGATVRDGDLVGDTVGVPGEVDVFPLQLGDATVFRLVQITGETGASGVNTLHIGLDGPHHDDISGFTVTSTYQYRVRPGTAYSLRVSRHDSDTGPYCFRLITAKDRRIPANLGDSITGRLDIPGRVDLYQIDVHQTGKLHLADATGCQFSTAATEDTPAPHIYSPANVCWDLDLATLTPGERILLIVWSPESATGPYSFRLAVR